MTKNEMSRALMAHVRFCMWRKK